MRVKKLFLLKLVNFAYGTTPLVLIQVHTSAVQYLFSCPLCILDVFTPAFESDQDFGMVRVLKVLLLHFILLLSVSETSLVKLFFLCDAGRLQQALFFIGMIRCWNQSLLILSWPTLLTCFGVTSVVVFVPFIKFS